MLWAEGLLIVGLDVIGPCLTEVNVTSPTCFVEIAEQTGFDVAGLFADALLRAVGNSARKRARVAARSANLTLVVDADAAAGARNGPGRGRRIADLHFAPGNRDHRARRVGGGATRPPLSRS